MSKTDMKDYMRVELWMDRVLETISHWEKMQGLEVPEDVKKTVTNYMRVRVSTGIRKGTLIRTFMQVAVTALIYIKMKKLDK